MTKGMSDKPRVLVVEDEPIAREILTDLLKMAGYEVLSTHSGEQALLALVQERGRVDCLFTAVELPGLVDGWMLADEFRVRDQTLPVVLAAGSPSIEGGAAERTAFVAHPVLPPKAVEAVNKVTGRGGAVRPRPQVVAETDASESPDQPQEAATRDTRLRAAG